MTLPDSYFKGAPCPYCESKDTLRVNRRTWACRGCHRGWKGEHLSPNPSPDLSPFTPPAPPTTKSDPTSECCGRWRECSDADCEYAMGMNPRKHLERPCKWLALIVTVLLVGGCDHAKNPHPKRTHPDSGGVTPIERGSDLDLDVDIG